MLTPELSTRYIWWFTVGPLRQQAWQHGVGRAPREPANPHTRAAVYPPARLPGPVWCLGRPSNPLSGRVRAVGDASNKLERDRRRRYGSESVVRAWGQILSGYRPNLSIEITRECPLRCPGCYAYGDTHLGGDVVLRQLSDFKGQALIDGMLRGRPRVSPDPPLDRRRRAARPLPRARCPAAAVDRQWACTPRWSRARSGRFPPAWADMARLQVVVSDRRAAAGARRAARRPPPTTAS